MWNVAHSRPGIECTSPLTCRLLQGRPQIRSRSGIIFFVGNTRVAETIKNTKKKCEWVYQSVVLSQANARELERKMMFVVWKNYPLISGICRFVDKLFFYNLCFFLGNSLVRTLPSLRQTPPSPCCCWRGSRKGGTSLGPGTGYELNIFKKQINKKVFPPLFLKKIWNIAYKPSVFPWFFSLRITAVVFVPNSRRPSRRIRPCARTHTPRSHRPSPWCQQWPENG